MGKEEPEFFCYEAKKIPYFYFTYAGKAPKIGQGKQGSFSKESVHYRTFYLEQTFKQYDFSKIHFQFHQAVMITVHHFKDDHIRDLDNIYHKHLVDAIKKTTLIPDDSYRHLSHLYMGKAAREDFIEVYLMSKNSFPLFIAIAGLFNTQEAAGEAW